VNLGLGDARVVGIRARRATDVSEDAALEKRTAGNRVEKLRIMIHKIRASEERQNTK